jgi:hypothetical protein
MHCFFLLVFPERRSPIDGEFGSAPRAGHPFGLHRRSRRRFDGAIADVARKLVAFGVHFTLLTAEINQA